VFVVYDHQPATLADVAEVARARSVYALVALGFVLIFKATEVVNFSQGALAMSARCSSRSSWSTRTCRSSGSSRGQEPDLLIGGPTGCSGFLSLIVALLFAAVLGLVIERIAIRPMIGEPLFSVAVITLGLEIVLRVLAVDAVKVQFRSHQRSVGFGRLQHRRARSSTGRTSPR
jgi:branched-subunit amino acid ABC-type transport system permease component